MHNVVLFPSNKIGPSDIQKVQRHVSYPLFPDSLLQTNYFLTVVRDPLYAVLHTIKPSFDSHQVLVHNLIVYLVYSRPIIQSPAQTYWRSCPERRSTIIQHTLQQYHTTKAYSQSAYESIQLINPRATTSTALTLSALQGGTSFQCRFRRSACKSFGEEATARGFGSAGRCRPAGSRRYVLRRKKSR